MLHFGTTKVTLFTMSKYEEAIQAYDKAIEINPQDAVPWYNKGIVLYNMSKYE